MTTTSETVEAVPFTMVLTKTDMIEHIERVHGVPLGRVFWNRSKTTKADMLEWHEDQHRALDLIEEFGGNEQAHRLTGDEKTRFEERARDIGMHRWPHQPAVRHEHVAVEAPENVAAAAKTLITGKDNTPIATLNASERKALKDVVDNDFGMLRQEIRAMSADIKAQRRREVEAEWAERRKAVSDYERRARKAVAAVNKKFATLREEARLAGITLTTSRCETYGIKAEVEGFDKAMREAMNEVERDEERALLTLERQRLTAQRTVLLTGISGDVAQTVLGAIPSAQTLMVEAAKTKAAAQIDA